MKEYFYFWSILSNNYQSTSITVLHWGKRNIRNITLTVAILTTVRNVHKQRSFCSMVKVRKIITCTALPRVRATAPWTKQQPWTGSWLRQQPPHQQPRRPCHRGLQGDWAALGHADSELLPSPSRQTATGMCLGIFQPFGVSSCILLRNYIILQHSIQ